MGIFSFKRRGALSPRDKTRLDYLQAQNEDEQARLDFIEIWTDVPRDDSVTESEANNDEQRTE